MHYSTQTLTEFPFVLRTQFSTTVRCSEGRECRRLSHTWTKI